MSTLIASGTTNAKTAKNNRISAIMYLAPFTQNSKKINLCAKASPGCALACLYSAGRGKFNSVQQARTRKSNLYVNSRKLFLSQLLKELISLNKRAGKKGVQIAVRLNGTSDLDFIGQIKNNFNFDVLSLTNLVFYDYTKILGKIKKYADVSNRYRLTFSRSEINDSEVMQAIKLGSPVSVVFGVQRKGTLPTTWKGIPVIDGDLADDLMLDNKGAYIIGLRFKGSKKDMLNAIATGFVIPVA